jgi:hypothetical protein
MVGPAVHDVQHVAVPTHLLPVTQCQLVQLSDPLVYLVEAGVDLDCIDVLRMMELLSLPSREGRTRTRVDVVVATIVFRRRAWEKRRMIVISSVFIAVVFAFVTAGPPVFTTSLVNSSITGRSIRVLKCRCDRRYSRREQSRAMTDRFSFVGWTKCTSGTLGFASSNPITPPSPFAIIPLSPTVF